MKNKRVATPTGDMVLFVHENRHRRPLRALAELQIRFEDFFYIVGDDVWTPRLFEYRGAWFDSHEFEVAPDWIKALGYDAWQTQDAFSAVVVCWFDRDGDPLDDEVIVGYIHW